MGTVAGVSRWQLLRWYYSVTRIGIIIHEIAHYWFAGARGLEIHEVDFFSLSGDTLGYVKHEHPRTFRGWFAVSFAPFLVNSGVAFASFSVVGVALYRSLPNIPHPIALLCLAGIGWIGISAGVHAFPSNTDVTNLTTVKRHLWSTSAIPWLQPKVNAALSASWLLVPVVGPFWLCLKVFQTLIYVARAPSSIISLPLIGIIMLGNRWRSYGSQLIFTAILIGCAAIYIPHGAAAVGYLIDISGTLTEHSPPVDRIAEILSF